MCYLLVCQTTMLLIVAAFVVILLFYSYRNLTYWQRNGVPCKRGWPLVGNFAQGVFRKKDMATLFDELYRAFPDKRYLGLYAMTSRSLIIRDPELIRKLIVKEFDTFTQHKMLVPEDVDPLWSKNLFSMKGGPEWQDMRATLSPSFTSSKLRLMFGLVKECSKQFISHFEKKGESVQEMKETYARFLTDVVGTTAFGVTCNSLEDRSNEFYNMGKEATEFTSRKVAIVLLNLFLPGLIRILNLRWYTKKSSDFFMGLIKDSIELREHQGIIRPDVIHLLMEAQKGRLKYEESTEDGFAVVEESEHGKSSRKKAEITLTDITAQALVFFFAGFESVSTTLCYASYELALNPDIQEKLCNEIDEALENSELTYDVLMGMKYLDMVITETLRKWPPVVAPERVSSKPYILEPERPDEKPLHLPKDFGIVYPVFSIHRDAKYYPNPEKFDPERFSDENKHNIKPYTYLPFGTGPRNCIGSRFALMESKLLLAEILSKFEFVPVEKTPIPIRFSRSNFNPVPDEGFWLGLKLRKNKG